MEPVREIHLPVTVSPGSFDHRLFSELSARDHFAMRVAPDQSLLVFDSDPTGKWPLIRLRRWWTGDPEQQVLEVPGWSDAVAKYLADVLVDVQVTPDGRYAIAFSEAVWMKRTSFLLHVPRGYVARKPDTIVTVIDLERWQVVKSVHTVGVAEQGIDFAWVMGNRWVAIEGGDGKVSECMSGCVSAQEIHLLSIPELTPGPSCVAREFFHQGPPPAEGIVRSKQVANDAACGAVLNAVGLSSTEELEIRVRRGSGMEPADMRLRDVRWKDDSLEQESHHVYSERERLWDAQGEADDYFRHWGEWPYDDIYWQNLPRESSARLWYGLYPAQERGLYELDRYDAEGKEQAARTERRLVCGDAALGNVKSACGCGVTGVSEEGRTLLTYCRQQRGDFAGVFQKQWLSVFYSDDLTEAGLIELPKSSEMLEALAEGGGEVYVVTLEHGEVLRVYAVPRRP
ncbi:MAG: hypothetical protein WBY53_00175 [Acidobacteriaceae bacterium]